MTDWYKIKRVLIWVNWVEKQIYPASRLPSAYQEVEWIESDWVSCGLNTWIKPKDSPYFKIEFKMRPTTLKQGGYNYFYWAWNSPRCSFEYMSTQSLYANWNIANTVQKWSHSMSVNNDYEYSITYNNWTFTSIWAYNWTIYYSWTTLWVSYLHFFCSGNVWDELSSQSKERLYYLKLYQWQNFDLVREFVPCYRKSDNVIWMYDTVNGVFYTNAWSGTFTKWPNV